MIPCDVSLIPSVVSLIPWLPVQVKMTLLLSAVAVPINTVFGVTCAILIARNEFPGKLILTSMLDLPFSISPVVTGQLAHRCIQTLLFYVATVSLLVCHVSLLAGLLPFSPQVS